MVHHHIVDGKSIIAAMAANQLLVFYSIRLRLALFLEYAHDEKIIATIYKTLIDFICDAKSCVSM